MKRFVIVIGGVLALVATACGSSSSQQFRASLIEGGATEAQADCVLAELDSLGIDPESITDGALGDNEPPAEAAEAVLGCLFGEDLLDGLDDLDSDSSTNVPTPGADTFGDDPALDALWTQCEGGDGEACDDLFFQSPVGSDYEAFGQTCARTTTVGSGTCVVFGNSGGSDSSPDADVFGDDPTLDALWIQCEDGDGEACDELFFESPVDSDYELFGDTCGGRFDPGEVFCTDAMG